MRELVTCQAEADREAEAYVLASKLIHRAMVAKFPSKDMTVLKKYDLTRRDACFRLQQTSGGVTAFNFRSDQEAPLTPDRGYCHIYQIDEVATSAVEAWSKAKYEHEKAIQTKYDDYYALIESARNFEDVVDIWPEAAQAASKCNARALVVGVTPEVVSRIRQDVASRHPETAK